MYPHVPHSGNIAGKVHYSSCNFMSVLFSLHVALDGVLIKIMQPYNSGSFYLYCAVMMLLTIMCLLVFVFEILNVDAQVVGCGVDFWRRPWCVIASGGVMQWDNDMVCSWAMNMRSTVREAANNLERGAV